MIAILLILGFSIFLLFLTGIINIATDPMSIDQEERQKRGANRATLRRPINS